MESFAEVFYRCWQEIAVPAPPKLHYLSTVDSTSSDLRRRLEAGLPLATIVAAEYQTAGRGRSGNRWHSQRGNNLYVSAALEIDTRPEDRLPLVPLAAGVAAIDAILDCVSAEVLLKWPNDILLKDRKLAGILCELPRPDLWPGRVIVGLGINISVLDFPSEIKNTAISLAEVVASQNGSLPHPATLACRFVSRLREWSWDQMDIAERIVDEWKARAEPFGRRVRTRSGEGITVDLNRHGNLIVDTGGEEHIAVAGGIVENMEKER